MSKTTTTPSNPQGHQPAAPAWLSQVPQFHVPGLDVGSGEQTADPAVVGPALAVIAEAMDTGTAPEKAIAK